MARLGNKLFSTMTATLVLLFLLVTSDSKIAQGNGSTSEFEGIDINCDDGSSFIVSDDERIAGESDVTLTFSDTDVLRVDARYFPDAFPESEWIAPGQTSLKSPAPVQHRGYAIGGELDGYRIVFTAAMIADPDNSVIEQCVESSFLTAVQLIGIIIAPPRHRHEAKH